jgi:hypothetical protein
MHRFVVSWVNAAGAKEGEEILDFEVLQAGAPTAEGGAAPSEKSQGGLQH